MKITELSARKQLSKDNLPEIYGDIKYDLDEMVTFEQVTIPHAKGAYKIVGKPTSKAVEKYRYEIESREENGLQIFRLIDKSSEKYIDKILKKYYDHMERTARQPDYIYMSFNTLKHVAQEVRPYNFFPGPSSHRLSDSTLYGMKMRISESVPDGEVYLIREEPWI